MVGVIPAPAAMGIAALDPSYAATQQFVFVGWVERSDTHHFGTNPVKVNMLQTLANRHRCLYHRCRVLGTQVNLPSVIPPVLPILAISDWQANNDIRFQWN